MVCEKGFEDANALGIERIRELWRLKRRFEKYSVLMGRFTLRESLILHRVMQADAPDPAKINDEEMQVVLDAEKRILGDNGHGDGDVNA